MLENNKYTSKQEIDKMKIDLEKKLNSKIKKFTYKRVNRFINVVIMAFLVGIFVNIELDKQAGRIPDVFGLQVFQVETASMEPTLPVGTLILNQIPKDESDIEEADIITFTYENNIITHRIVAIKQDDKGRIYYQTKGDNINNSIDPWNIYFEDIISKNIMQLPF